MRVLEVQLRDFRTYARAQASLGEFLTVVHGPNGAGKSNLLEALYFGCTGRSTRTRNERELIRFGAQTTRVSVQLSDGGRAHELSVAYGALADGARPIKRMAADGVSVERLLDVAHRPLVSVFAPDRLGLLKGPPSLRRAHLDQLIAAIWPLRADVRRSYARALAQRNALLARVRFGSATAAGLPAWDRELATHAVALRAHRAQAVALLEQPLAQRASELGCVGSVQLEYRSGTVASEEQELLAFGHVPGCERRHEQADGEVSNDGGQAKTSGHPAGDGCRQEDKADLKDGRGCRLHSANHPQGSGAS